MGSTSALSDCFFLSLLRYEVVKVWSLTKIEIFIKETFIADCLRRGGNDLCSEFFIVAAVNKNSKILVKLGRETVRELWPRLVKV